VLIHELKTVFVHVPKAAGQSVEMFFLNGLGETWQTRSRFLLRKNRDLSRGPERLAHLFAREYVEFGYIAQHDYESYFKFAIVRNPWARIVSEYCFRGHARSFTFRDFLTRHLPAPSMSDQYRHIVPQCDFLFDGNGRKIVDYVGRFENINEDFKPVCDRLGLKFDKLPHVNAEGNARRSQEFGEQAGARFASKSVQQRHAHYSMYFDDFTRDLVAQLYRKDIEQFGYSFEDVRPT